MEPMAFALTLVGGAVSAAAGAAAQATTGEELPAIYTQLGVFAICMAIAWFMLRRSDQRDALSRNDLMETLTAERDARMKAEGHAEAVEAQLLKLTQAMIDRIKGDHP